MPDLSTELHDLIEHALPDLDVDAIVTTRRHQRNRRRTVVTGATALVAVVAVVVALGTAGSHHARGVQIQGTAPSSTPTTAANDAGLVPVPTVQGPSPAIASVLALPACSDVGDFVSWAQHALLPYDGNAIIGASRFFAEPLSAVAAHTAVIAEPSPAGCILAGRLGVNAEGWERRDPQGHVLSRAISLIQVTQRVPSRMTAHTTSYHQDSIATGQELAGFIERNDLEAIIGGSEGHITIMSIDDLNATTYQQGVALEERLYLANFNVVSNTTESLGDPTKMVPGLGLCSLPFTYCDGTGRSVTIAQAGPLPTTGTRLTINGQAAITTTDQKGTVHVAVKLAYPGYSLVATGTGGITADQLVAVLKSSPVLSAAYLHPSSGTGDLRPQFNDVWLSEKLAAAGLRNITIAANLLPAVSPNTGPPTANPFVRAGFTSADGTQGRGVFGPQAPLNTLPPLGKVVKLGAVQFQTNESQTYGYCNDIFVNIMSPNSADVARTIVRQLGC